MISQNRFLSFHGPPLPGRPYLASIPDNKEVVYTKGELMVCKKQRS